MKVQIKKNKNIRISTINTQSIRNKDILLHNHLCDNGIDICIASETWVMDTTQDETWIKTSTLENGGYNINIANRKERSGGGLALVTKNKYEVKTVNKGENLSFQYALQNIAIHKIELLLVIAVYTPPYSSVNQTTLNTFLNEFPHWLSTKITEDKNIVVVGDFNVHVNDECDIDANIFNDMMIAMGLKQWVTFPTHCNGNTLDLVMTQLGSKLTVNKC